MSRPVLLAVDADPAALHRVTAELDRRYGDDFLVVGEADEAAGVGALERAHRDGQPVAVVLVAPRPAEVFHSTVLARARMLHPLARRALLVEWGAWGDPTTARAILHAMALGEINYYVLKPWTSPDELFHRTVAEFVQEWSRTDASNPREVVVLAALHDRRGHEIRSLLARNGIPHAFVDRSAPQGERLLSELAPGPDPPPVLVWMPALGGPVLRDPTDVEIVEAWGIDTTLPPHERDVDVVVVGAGPAGLAAAVYASSEGLSTVVVERESLGGQAASSSLIRNYLGFSRGVTGAELAQRGFQQAWVFGTRLLLVREATALRAKEDRYVVTVGGVGEVTARAVVLATGVSYRRLGIPDLEEFTGAGVFYGASISEAQALSGRRAAVVGGGNSAGQAALHLMRYAAGVVLLVRGPSLAEGMSQYLSDEIATSGVEVRLNSEVVGGGGDGRLERLRVRDRTTGEESALTTDGLFVMIGAEPRTDWLPGELARDERGYISSGHDAAGSGWPLARAPLPNETSLPGVFVVGDVRAGSVKRVASAVGEGSVVVSQLHTYLSHGGPSTRPAAAGAAVPEPAAQPRAEQTPTP